MGFRMRKSIKVAPGVRLSVSKSWRRCLGRREGWPLLGALVGPSYHDTRFGRRPRRLLPEELERWLAFFCLGAASRPSVSEEAGHVRAQGREGALQGDQGAGRARRSGRWAIYHPDFRLPSYSLAGLMMLTSEPTEAEQLLGEAFATGKDPAEDKFVSSYLFTRLELSIAQGVTAELPVNRDAVGLALAELKQDHGDLAGAIDVVEQLEPTTYSAVSLAELYAQTGALGRRDRAHGGDEERGRRLGTSLRLPRSGLPAAGFPRRRPRVAEGSPALTITRGADPAPGPRRAGPELPRPETRRGWLARTSNESWPRTRATRACATNSPNSSLETRKRRLRLRH